MVKGSEKGGCGSAEEKGLAFIVEVAHLRGFEVCHEHTCDGDLLPVERGVTFGLTVFEKAQGDGLAKGGGDKSRRARWRERGIRVDHAIQRKVGDPTRVEGSAQEGQGNADVALAVRHGFGTGQFSWIAQDVAFKGAKAKVGECKPMRFDGFTRVWVADVLVGDIGFDVLCVMLRKPPREDLWISERGRGFRRAHGVGVVSCLGQPVLGLGGQFVELGYRVGGLTGLYWDLEALVELMAGGCQSVLGALRQGRRFRGASEFM